MAKWYVLGANATGFYDPKQPDPLNNFLYAGEARLFEDTENTTQWKVRGGIVEVTEKEAAEINKKNDSTKTLVKDSKANDKAAAILEAAAAKEQVAADLHAQANVKLNAAQVLIDQNDLLTKQLAEANAKLDDKAKK